MTVHVPPPVTNPAALAGKARFALDQAFGARIAAYRKAKGLSQSDLGAAVGVSFQQVQKYERGQNRVSALRAVAIAHRLDVPLATLLGVDAAAIEAGEAR